MPDTIFHCIDILPRDEIILSEDETSAEVVYDSNEEEDYECERRKVRTSYSASRSQLIIHMFGRTATGLPVSLDIEGFCPYFFVSAPELSPAQLRAAQRQLADYVERFGQRNVRIQLEFREKFYGFTNHTNFPFFRLTVPSMTEFRRLKDLFLDKELRPQVRARIGNLWSTPQVFEANIDPELRFLHERDLAPCGWIKVGAAATGDETIRVHYTELNPATAPMTTAPFKSISWDLECYSANGLFPQAKKTYSRLAKEICVAAMDSAAAASALETMLFEGSGPLTRMTFKNRLAPGARDAFRQLMARDRAINKAVAAYASATNAEERDEVINSLGASLDTLLGVRFVLAGDPCIQIGSVVSIGAQTTDRHIFVWPSCDPVDGAVVHASVDEASMWRAWFEWLEYENPDIMMGYNTSNFDERYVWERAVELGLEDNLSFGALNRLEGGQMKLNEMRLSSSALGDNFMHLLNMQGRLQIDLYSFIKAKEKLDSYKLDSVAKHYMSGSLIQCATQNDGHATLRVKGAVQDCRTGRALVLLDESGDTMTQKLIIVSVDGATLKVRVPDADKDAWDDDVLTNARRWVIVKDDISPADIFRLHEGTAADRATVARYCIQDCDLVLDLYRKLEVFVNSMAMANVCTVPVRYIFTRGQGIKIESLIFKECSALNKCIMTLPRPSGGGGESYEGAIVLTPQSGLYHRSPIGVGDFASLYPSSIVSENISHDTLIWSKDYSEDGTFVRMSYGSEEYEAAEGVEHTDIRFDLWIPDPEDKRKDPAKIKNGFRICRYAQDAPGTLPIIIKKLLAARNAKKKEMGRESDALRKILLDGEQLAYKLTANALYGQLGSRTFKVRLQDLAASTTAYGRLQIMFAKEVIESFYGSDPRCAARIIYGDTDSLFIEWNPLGSDGRPLEGRAAREAAIELTTESGHLVSQALKAPHDFEFDKVYHPFLIFSKKRYAGHLYESNPDDYYPMYMGIALRRRDSAPVVKTIYGRALTEVLTTGNVERAYEIVRTGAMDLAQGKMKLGLLTMSQSLKAEYANPQSIAHKVLADRMAARDAGTAPTVGDRVPYVFVKTATVAKLKGDMIESPAFVREHGLEIDAAHYIRKQLMKPIGQMFGVLLERMPGFTANMLPMHKDEDRRADELEVWLRRYGDIDEKRRATLSAKFEEMLEDKALDAREAAAADLLFSEALRFIECGAKRQGINKLFGGKAVITALPTRAKAAAAAPAPAVQPPPKQSRLTSFMINRQIHDTISRRKSRSRESSVSAGSKASAKGK
jgi:DNA polymerase elongation subunit (family B)